MKRTYLVLIATFLVIGFAAVATNLIMNGTINFGFNDDDFNDGVVFSYAHTDTGTATINEDTKKSITFISDKLENLEQQAILEYDVANKSEQYDANVTLDCNITEEQYEEYVTFDNTMEDSFKLEAGKTESGTITVTLAKVATSDIDISLVCEINATALPREDRQEYVPLVHPYKEILLQGADPVLEVAQEEAMAIDIDVPKKLVPVIIDEQGKVKKADIEKQWYDYENQWWANAVILNEDATEPEIGKVIDESDIESYFVWIPKFKYKIFNMGDYDSVTEGITEYEEKSQPIEIQFGTDNTENSQTECKTPGVSGENGDCAVNKWMTHPAFTSFGDINGFWVGKFEVGEKDATSSGQTERTEYNIDDLSKIVIKPNMFPITKINMSTAYQLSYNYERELDSHLIKNTEWGAVAYLAQSIYGICTENPCTKIMPNNNTKLVTGYSALNEEVTSTLLPFNDDDNSVNYTNSKSVKASTTNNYTGIYDLSGGTSEYTAGITEEVKNQSDFLIDAKYYDLYKYGSNSYGYSNRILGDATGEMGPFYKGSENNESFVVGSWYQQYTTFITKTSSYITRGGTYFRKKRAGMFSNTGWTGNVTWDVTFRIVLAPQ